MAETGIPEALAEHVVASSEPEAPEETLERLYGDHEEADAERALSAVAAVVGGGEATGADEADVERRHEVDFGDRVERAACADGALFAAEAAPVESVTVRSRDPVRDETVRFERDADGWAVTPDDALVSLGLAADVAEDEDMLTAGLGLASGGCVDDRAGDVLCRHFNAFVDVDAYETWAAASDAVSVAMRATAFAAMIRDVADAMERA